MKTTVSKYDFHRAFEELRLDNFSYHGLNALFQWFESMEDDCGTESELDVIAICRDFTEYENLKEFQGEYSKDYETIEAIEDETIVIRVGSEGFIIESF